MAYKFQMGLADLSGSIELTSATAELKVSDQSGNLKASMDVAGVISGSAIQGATLATNDVVRINAAGAGSFVGVAAGGAITTATTITASGLIHGGSLSGSSLSLADGAVTSTAAELNLVDGSSAGTVINSKAVVYGASGQVAATTVTASGLITADSLSTTEFTVSDAGLVTAVGVVAGGPISAATSITGSGEVSAGTYVGAGGLFATSVNGSVTAGGVSGSLASSLLSLSVNAGAASISSAGAASFSTLAASGLASVASISMDNGSTLGPDSVADLLTFAADGDITMKDGLYDFDIASHDGSNGLKLGGVLVSSTAAELNLVDSFDAAYYTASADSFVWFDATDSKMKRMANDTFLGTIAGAGVSVIGNQLAVDTTGGDSMSSNVIANNGILQSGLNYLADISSDTVIDLPGSPGVGDIFVVKLAGLSGAGTDLTINTYAAQTIDGLPSIKMESPYAAVTIIANASGSFRIV